MGIFHVNWTNFEGRGSFISLVGKNPSISYLVYVDLTYQHYYFKYRNCILIYLYIVYACRYIASVCLTVGNGEVINGLNIDH